MTAVLSAQIWFESISNRYASLRGLLFSGKLDLDNFISKRISLENINQAYDEMLTGVVARNVITFNID